MVSVATIVVAPWEPTPMILNCRTYVMRTVGASLRIHRNNNIREGALLQLLAIEGDNLIEAQLTMCDKSNSCVIQAGCRKVL